MKFLLTIFIAVALSGCFAEEPITSIVGPSHPQFCSALNGQFLNDAVDEGMALSQSLSKMSKAAMNAYKLDMAKEYAHKATKNAELTATISMLRLNQAIYCLVRD